MEYNPQFLIQVAQLDLEKIPADVRDGILAEATRQKLLAEYRLKEDREYLEQPETPYVQKNQDPTDAEAVDSALPASTA